MGDGGSWTNYKSIAVYPNLTQDELTARAVRAQQIRYAEQRAARNDRYGQGSQTEPFATPTRAGTKLPGKWGRTVSFVAKGT
jgi:hypothetical protein